jgi:predicted Zn-dependent protease
VTLVTVVAVVAGGWFGGWRAYAGRQWHRAQEAVRAGRPAEARTRLETCLAVWPDDPDVLRLAARADQMAGDFPAAEAHLNACLRVEGGASEATQLEFLLIRAQTGEVEEVAGLLFGFVDRKHPDAPLILETIALAHMRNLRYGPAFAALNRSAEEFPGRARTHHYRGWVLEKLNQPKAALDDYLKALALDPELDRVRLRVAEMYMEDNDPVEATPHLERLWATSPDRPEVLARLGQARFLQGDHAEARRLLERAVVHLPEDPAVLLFLSKLDLEDGEPARAEARLRAALAADPAATEARYTLVTALRAQRKDAAATAELAEYDRHKAILERANHLLQEEARHPTRDPGPASEIGALLLQIRQDRQGLYWMDEALSRDPNHRPTHQVLAEYFERQGDPDRAAAHRKHLQ